MLTKVDVIRHGEPEGGRRYRGSGVDDALTDTGWRQMWDAMPEKIEWNHIISSPLKRCSAFAAIMAKKYDLPFNIDDRFKEIGFGIWEGLTPEEIITNDSNAIDHFYADPVNNRPEGAEPLEDFSDRIWTAYQDIVEQHKHKHTLIIGHAGVARAITANVLGMSLDDVYSKLRIEYGSIICSVMEDNKPPKIVV